MNDANYRKHNDRTLNSSTYHKKDGTPVRGILKQEAEKEIQVHLRELLMSDYKEPHKQVFNIPVGGGQSGITSVVCDQCDFDKMCDKLEGIIDLMTGSRADDKRADAIREAKHLPMAARGTKTQWLFDMFDVETDHICVCVRGFAARMIWPPEGADAPN